MSNTYLIHTVQAGVFLGKKNVALLSALCICTCIFALEVKNEPHGEIANRAFICELGMLMSSRYFLRQKN